MTFRPFTMDLELEGAELLADALLNAPELVTDAAWRAGEGAARLLRPSIARFTPVDTGYLVSNGDVVVVDAFTVQYENITPYAGYVTAYVPYVELGRQAVAGDIDAIYERAFDDLAETFGSGR